MEGADGSTDERHARKEEDGRQAGRRKTMAGRWNPMAGATINSRQARPSAKEGRRGGGVVSDRQAGRQASFAIGYRKATAPTTIDYTISRPPLIVQRQQATAPVFADS